MIATSDLEQTVQSCDLVRFRAFIGDVLEKADDFRECEHIVAMQTFYHAPTRENLRDLLVIAWPLFTMARQFPGPV